jgi:hypothetical protein
MDFLKSCSFWWSLYVFDTCVQCALSFHDFATCAYNYHCSYCSCFKCVHYQLTTMFEFWYNVLSCSCFNFNLPPLLSQTSWLQNALIVCTLCCVANNLFVCMWRKSVYYLLAIVKSLVYTSFTIMFIIS